MRVRPSVMASLDFPLLWDSPISCLLCSPGFRLLQVALGLTATL